MSGPGLISDAVRPADLLLLQVVALVGKGLTFDSGGYNIKAGPGSMIELMKFDMGGAERGEGRAHEAWHGRCRGGGWEGT